MDKVLAINEKPLVIGGLYLIPIERKPSPYGDIYISWSKADQSIEGGDIFMETYYVSGYPHTTQYSSDNSPITTLLDTTTNLGFSSNVDNIIVCVRQPIITSCSYMFNNVVRATNIDISLFNTSNVTSMMAMFQHVYSMDTIDLSTLDTSKVIDMSRMFSDTKFKTLDLSTFNTSSVENMSNMFLSETATSGSEPSCLIDINFDGFDTRNVKYMYGMFQYCRKLTTLDLSSFRGDNLIRAQEMFEGCQSLCEIDLSNLNTPKIESCDYMFAMCSSLTDIKLSQDFIGDNLINARCMFNGCGRLTKLDLRNLNTPRLANTMYMFYNCSLLEELDLSSFIYNDETLLYADGMFTGCDGLEIVYVDNCDNDTINWLKGKLEGDIGTMPTYLLTTYQGRKALVRQ